MDTKEQAACAAKAVTPTPESDAYGARHVPDCLEAPHLNSLQIEAMCGVLKAWGKLSRKFEAIAGEQFKRADNYWWKLRYDSVTELAVDNSNVRSFMRHWTERATKAEQRAEALQQELKAVHIQPSRTNPLGQERRRPGVYRAARESIKEEPWLIAVVRKPELPEARMAEIMSRPKQWVVQDKPAAPKHLDGVAVTQEDWDNAMRHLDAVNGGLPYNTVPSQRMSEHARHPNGEAVNQDAWRLLCQDYERARQKISETQEQLDLAREATQRYAEHNKVLAADRVDALNKLRIAHRDLDIERTEVATLKMQIENQAALLKSREAELGLHKITDSTALASAQNELGVLKNKIAAARRHLGFVNVDLGPE